MKYKIKKDEAREADGHKVFRIYAESNFTTLGGLEVETGERGGWVESENNLAQDGGCWVADDAAVYGNARVSDDALVAGNARISDNAEVYDAACVFGNVIVKDRSCIREGARVSDNAVVEGNSWLTDNAVVCNNARVSDAQIGSGVIISGGVHVKGNGGWVRATAPDNSWLLSRMKKTSKA